VLLQEVRRSVAGVRLCHNEPAKSLFYLVVVLLQEVGGSVAGVRLCHNEPALSLFLPGCSAAPRCPLKRSRCETVSQ
jgi:hypothetical protein